MGLSDLATRWTGEAESLERWGDTRGAAILRTCATQLNLAAREYEGEELTIPRAAEESGYSRDHLRSLVASGGIPNADRKGSPRIRRRDLPAKPGAGHRDREKLVSHFDIDPPATT